MCQYGQPQGMDYVLLICRLYKVTLVGAGGLQGFIVSPSLFGFENLLLGLDLGQDFRGFGTKSKWD